jgi:meiosis arrest female protein 1
MADRLPSQYFNDFVYASHANYQRSIIPDTFSSTSSNSSYRSVQRQTSSQQNDLLYGTAISYSGTTHFNSTGQISAPYYTSSSSIENRSTPRHEQSISLLNTTANFNDSGISCILQESDLNNSSWSFNSSSLLNTQREQSLKGNDGTVTLQLSNLDTTYEQASLKKFLISKLQPMTRILSFTFEGVIAKLCLPSLEHAKQVVSYLHRKKVGHKRITVSYTKDCNFLDPSTLRCQVAGLLKDIPGYRLSMYKFRELFQSRFKTSISVGNLCAMNDICSITENLTEKFVCLRPELIQSIDRGELNDCFLQSVPYCSIHFKKGHRGWAEQEIEPLPNVWMSLSDVKSMIFALTQRHSENIPVASLVHCIQNEFKFNIVSNEQGINLEHLISCVNEIQITTNKFGIKILNWVPECGNQKDLSDDYLNSKGKVADAYGQFSADVFELLQMCPKSTMKFSRFIPTYHNTFNKQCRVADYGYVKLIDLFEAIPLIVQIMGEGENRQITLTHKRQMRRFETDLYKILRIAGNKPIRLSDVPMLLSSNQKKFEITDYGICDIIDVVDELKNSNLVLVERMTNSDDMLLSLPKRRQSSAELRKTSVFASETIDLLKIAPQYTIPYEKFACRYHYHFTYQLRLNDYGVGKLADMMEGLSGIVKIEMFNEDRKIFLSPKVAQRVFSEQLRDITETMTGNSFTFINVVNVLAHHKKNFGYEIRPETLGFSNLWSAIKSLPFVELVTQNEDKYIICHHNDDTYKCITHKVGMLLNDLLLESCISHIPVSHFINSYFEKHEEVLNESLIESMNHLIDMQIENNIKLVGLSKLALFLLQVIDIIKSIHSITLSQLKAELNSKLNLSNVCFQIGYPDLETIIEVFNDIFVVHGPLMSSATNEWTDRSQITFNENSIFAQNKVTEFGRNVNYNMQIRKPVATRKLASATPIRTENENIKRNTTLTGTEQRVPFAELGKICSNNQQFNGSPFTTSVKFMRTNNNEMIPNNITIAQKENFNFFANDFQRNVQESNMTSLKRKSLKRTHDQLQNSQLEDIEEILNNKISTSNLLSLYLAPPKPDTPTNGTVPFWMDPIWHTSPKLSPSTEVLNIPIPELKTFPLLPKIDTPTMMERLSHNNPGIFKFDTQKIN